MGKKASKNIIQNNLVYNIWWERLANIIINSFKWEGLDQTTNDRLTSRIIEMTLFKYGYGVFTAWEDKLIFLPAAVSGDLNLYFEPTSFQLIGNMANIPTAHLEDNAVLCRNVCNNLPTINLVDYYASQLAAIQRAQDVNLFQSKLQVAMESDEDTIFSLKNAISEIDANQLVLYGKKDLISSVKTLDVRFNYLVDKYSEYKLAILNEFLQTFGYQNVGTQKRERLTQAEANSSNEFTYDGYVGAMLDMRIDACNQLKKVLGINLDVHLNRDHTIDKLIEETKIEATGGRANEMAAK